MYNVLMKYINTRGENDPFTFQCENFRVENKSYKFENILMDNFIISDFEVNDDDIALINIK